MVKYENNDFSNDVKYINKHSYDFLKKSQLFGNEVLMGKIGNAGRVYFVKKLDKPMSLAMNMFAMRFNEEIDSKYVYYCDIITSAPDEDYVGIQYIRIEKNGEVIEEAGTKPVFT